MKTGGAVAGTAIALWQGVIAHHFTVDVEEYFQVSAFEHCVRRADWTRFESRLAPAVSRLLHMLAQHQSRGTFFVVGWVAEAHPEIVREIANQGHEIASHSWDHARITTQSPADFRASVRRTKQTLEDLTGRPVLGFRAPSFSIVHGCEWALDILIEEGYHYDSSLFPIRRPGYGYAGAQTDPYVLRRPAGELVELPPATLQFGGFRIPAGGGAYFRLFPYSLIASALRECERRGQPGTFYIHPWELDPAQPRFEVSWSTRVRHYGGLEQTSSRLERLLSEFRFTAAADTVESLWKSPALARSA